MATLADGAERHLLLHQERRAARDRLDARLDRDLGHDDGAVVPHHRGHRQGAGRRDGGGPGHQRGRRRLSLDGRGGRQHRWRQGHRHHVYVEEGGQLGSRGQLIDRCLGGPCTPHDGLGHPHRRREARTRPARRRTRGGRARRPGRRRSGGCRRTRAVAPPGRRRPGVAATGRRPARPVGSARAGRRRWCAAARRPGPGQSSPGRSPVRPRPRATGDDADSAEVATDSAPVTSESSACASWMR